ncbi:MAG: hypothetical protein M1817_006641 [Caeruleum heppii]|nr:MAG: hypothetical protein M1817_006641 [Caeruleum heppii]
MVLDALSPVAPARVRALIIPVGNVKRSKFAALVDRLQKETIVRLGDVSPDVRPNRNMFSPLAFPNGSVHYHLTTSASSDSHSFLSPFELFRESLMIVGLADSQEIRLPSENDDGMGPTTGAEQDDVATYEGVTMALESMCRHFPRALVHRIVLFDHVSEVSKASLPEGIVSLPPLAQCRKTTIKTLMCDLTSVLLAEMTAFAKSLQALPSIDSPRIPSSGRGADNFSQDFPEDHNQSYTSRSSSTASKHTDRSHARMSMPSHLPSSTQPTAGSTSVVSSRPSTPPTQTPPATDDEDHSKAVYSPSRRPLSTVADRSSAREPARDSSRDRVSVHGFGSGSLSERARNKGRGRIALVVGSLYLHGGRWPDATKELIESATIARASSDHMWHAKALENILACMLMLAWAGMDFQIPHICYPVADKSTQATDSNGSVDGQPAFSSSPSNRLVSLENLAKLLPDLLNMILNLYIRAANFSGEELPELAFSETVVRFCKLLSAVHLCGGSLNDDAIRQVVLNVPVPNRPKPSIPRPLSHPTRTEITAMLLRAFPAPSSNSELSSVDKIAILGGMASVLSNLGLHRKKGLVMREMVVTLVPGLVRARTLSAAEIGVHPAAGLAALTSATRGTEAATTSTEGANTAQQGVEDLLGVLGRIYGVVSLTPSHPVGLTSSLSDNADRPTGSESLRLDDSDAAVVARILQDATLRAFGSRATKLDILKHCINLCEALPDFHGVLRFTAELLRTTGSGIAPKPDSDEGSTALSREEQMRLATNIPRTINAASKLGLANLEAEYWDEFLVRGVEMIELPSRRLPVAHAKSELEEVKRIEETKEKSPFIYNPFLKRPTAAAADKLLVVGERTEFRVTLQNPFDFDVEIERMRLETTGSDFESATQSTVIGAYRTKLLPLLAVPKQAGRLLITGCMVKVRGCRERRFPIFTEPWSPQREPKIKYIGLAALMSKSSARISAADTPSKEKPALEVGPTPTRLQLTVIDAQPIVAVESTSLSQPVIMLLQGEIATFTITLRNQSRTTPVDLLLVNFQDSTTTALRAARNSKGTSAAELYEIDLNLSRKEAFRWRRPANFETSIKPGGTMTLEVEVFGKLGLSNGLVQIDYAFLGQPRQDIGPTFYTRQVSVPIDLTVFPGVDLVRTEILPLPSEFPWRTRGGLQSPADPRTPHPLFQRVSDSSDAEEYCLLLLDFRNGWSSPLEMSIQVHDDSVAHNASPSPSYTVEDTIPPYQTVRHLVPIRRRFVADPYAAIPTLDAARKRQYIVNSSSQSPDIEQANREGFWYREEILKVVQAEWGELFDKNNPNGTTRMRGTVNLRTMRLGQAEVDAVKIETVGIEMALSGSEVTRRSRSSFAVTANDFSVLRIRLHNRSSMPVKPLLRLQPRLCHLSVSSTHPPLDLSKRLLWTGVLQRPLHSIEAGGTTEVELGLCVLCEGDYEFAAIAEEVTTTDRQSIEGESDKELQAKVVLDPRRRTWVAREPCRISARDTSDEESDDGG